MTPASVPLAIFSQRGRTRRHEPQTEKTHVRRTKHQISELFYFSWRSLYFPPLSNENCIPSRPLCQPKPHVVFRNTFALRQRSGEPEALRHKLVGAAVFPWQIRGDVDKMRPPEKRGAEKMQEGVGDGPRTSQGRISATCAKGSGEGIRRDAPFSSAVWGCGEGAERGYGGAGEGMAAELVSGGEGRFAHSPLSALWRKDAAERASGQAGHLSRRGRNGETKAVVVRGVRGVFFSLWTRR